MGGGPKGLARNSTTRCEEKERSGETLDERPRSRYEEGKRKEREKGKGQLGGDFGNGRRGVRQVGRGFYKKNMKGVAG